MHGRGCRLGADLQLGGTVLGLYLGLALLLAAARCQMLAYKHLADPWQHRFAEVTRSIPRREYYTARGWRWQLVVPLLSSAGILSLLLLW